MALTTYTELKAAVADWLHRTDLTSQVVDFITLAESEINTELRLRLMETDETLTLLNGGTTVALPARFSEPILLEIVYTGRDNRRLSYLTPQQMAIQTATSGEPTYYTINGDNIEFPFPSDQDYTLRFRMLADFDIASTSTNDLLDKYPGIYLYGSLLQAAPYMVNDARIQTWAAMYSNLVKKVNKAEGRTRTLTTLHSDLPSTGSRSNILRG